MNMYRATILGAVFLVMCALRFLLQPASAEDKYLTLEEAGKLGMKVELVTPKPRVYYATLHLTEVPQDVQIVIRDEKMNWIASANMAIRDNACSAWLAEEYVGKSYFLVTTKESGVERQLDRHRLACGPQ